MALLIAEMLLALGIIVFIMWWTMRSRIDANDPQRLGQDSKPDGSKPESSSGETSLTENASAQALKTDPSPLREPEVPSGKEGSSARSDGKGPMTEQ